MTGDDRARSHANARLELQIRELGVHLPGGSQCVASGVLKGQRGTEDSEGGITLKFIDDALVFVDDLHDAVEELVEGGHDVLRGTLRGEASGADDVHEQHRDVAGFAAQLRVLLQSAAGDLRADVAAEEVRDLLAFLQASHHLIEAGLHHADLGGIVNAHRGFQVSATHLVDGELQLAHRVHHTHRAQPRSKETSEQGGGGQRHERGDQVLHRTVEEVPGLRENQQQDAQHRHRVGQHPGSHEAGGHRREVGLLQRALLQGAGSDGPDQAFGLHVRHQRHHQPAQHGSHGNGDRPPRGELRRHRRENHHADGPQHRARHGLQEGDAQHQMPDHVRVIGIWVALPAQHGGEEDQREHHASHDRENEITQISNRGDGVWAGQLACTAQRDEEAQEGRDGDRTHHVRHQNHRGIQGPVGAPDPFQVARELLHGYYIIEPVYSGG